MNEDGLIGHMLDEFELVALLGAGGMAEVYLGRDLRLRREVAIKVLPARLATDPNYVTRFRDEARKVAALNHPNVVPIYSFGESKGRLYLVMPRLRESLRDYINRVGIMPIHESVTLIVQIATALEAAHKQGIVHRDVKPANILLDGKRKALLSDFGIARELSFLRQPGTTHTLSARGLPTGTPEYMAPEQLRDGPVDQRADIYGLGAVLYELFTGVAPHEAGSPYTVASLVLTTSVVEPSKRNPNIPPAMEQVVLTALAKYPDERYASMSEFASALQNALLLTNPSLPRYTIQVRQSSIIPTSVPAKTKPAQPLLRIFVSHSHADNSFTERLVKDLRRMLGNDDMVWYDESGGLRAGDKWWPKIVHEITVRPIFIAVLSPDATQSNWVMDEIDTAWGLKNSSDVPPRKFIPVIARKCDIRADLRTVQNIPFLRPTRYKEAFAKLCAAIGISPA